MRSASLMAAGIIFAGLLAAPAAAAERESDVTFSKHIAPILQRSCENCHRPQGAAPLLPAGTLIHVMAWYNNSPTNKNVVDSRNWKGYGNRSVDDMFFSITRTIELTEEEFQAEVAARGGTPAFATSQDQ